MRDAPSLSLTKPDDWHVHVRDRELLRLIVPDTSRRFARAIIMPDLNPPITSTLLAQGYRERIPAVPAGLNFKPLMTLFLTEAMRPDDVIAAKESGVVHGIKWYPAGATTNSQHGVKKITQCDPVLAAMEEHDLPLRSIQASKCSRSARDLRAGTQLSPVP